MRIEEIKELIEEYQAKFDQINETISDHQAEIEKIKKRRLRKLKQYQELEEELENLKREREIQHVLIEEQDKLRNQYNEEMLQQLLLLIQ